MSARPFTVDIREGRLLEVRIWSPIVAADVDAFADRLRALLGDASGRVVICVHLLGANVFPPEVSDAFIRVMRSDNPMMERSAFLVGASALFSLQVERMIRDAQNPARRAFRDAAELGAWLGEALGPAEQTRLAAFLGE